MASYTEDIKVEARKLVASGMNYREAGRALAVTDTTIRTWVDPAYAETRRLQIKQNRAEKYRPSRAKAKPKITMPATGARSEQDYGYGKP